MILKTKLLLTASVIFGISLFTCNVAAQTDSNYIYIIGTGGTIAGDSSSKISTNYEAGKLNATQLLKAVPQINDLSKIKIIDLFHIDSADISISNWFELAVTVNKVLDRDDVKGIVITHGTDTMEETAYFLNLIIKNNKPIVLVGSMRPDSSISADGPINLYNAVAVANSKSATGQGVLVVMNDQIFSARDVTKTNTTQVSTFKSPNMGAIGTVQFGNVNFYKSDIRKHTIETPFELSNLNNLPKVEIIYEYAGTDGSLFEAAIKSGVQGIVIAGTGDGNIAESERSLLKRARAKGIVIARSSRTGSGTVTYNYVHNLDSELGLIPADDLNPQKARILLMLSLTKTHDVSRIRHYFELY